MDHPIHVRRLFPIGVFSLALLVDMNLNPIRQADAEACHTFGTGPFESDSVVTATGITECSPIQYPGGTVTVTLTGPTSAQGTASGVNATVTLKVPCKSGTYTVKVTGTFGSYTNSATFSC